MGYIIQNNYHKFEKINVDLIFIDNIEYNNIYKF